MRSARQSGLIAPGAAAVIAGMLAAVAATGLGCASVIDPQSATAAVPYRLDDSGRMIVDVELNGHGTFPFLLDTGASISGISGALQRRLGVAADDRDVLVHGITTSVRLPLARLRSIALGAATWTDVRVAVLPDASSGTDGDNDDLRLSGILGSDVLSRYSVGFSTREQILRLYLPDRVSAARYAGWRTIALHSGAPQTPAASMLFFDLNIAGRDSRAIFDLGSGFNVVNWAAAEELGVTPRRFARWRGRDDSLAGVFAPLPALPRFVAGQTRTGAVTWSDEVFAVADLPIFATLALGDQPAALIGAGLFAQRDFLIDFSAPRILVSIAAAERSTVN